MKPESASRQPIVLLPACQMMLGREPFHVVGRDYAQAIRLAGAVPFVIPSAQPDELETLLAMADGVMLTGSPSNVHPSHFGEDVLDRSLPLDPDRDCFTLPLIRQALEKGMPLLGICRGFQEVNVALGGTLHQAVHQQAGLMDHRSDETLPMDQEYGFAHPVQVMPGGVLDDLIKGLDAPTVEHHSFMVNSLHGQGVSRLAEGLKVEARAPDGVIEAFTFDGPGFSLCLQWHPEWMAANNPVSRRIFAAFGDACQAYRRQREVLGA